ncbi:phosphatidylcholine transfer protein, putative [Eimeria praecox]|uniref:Phosphatidylcholine transfer protein, putative n=1 Tax=Eimeria praecox TaxID=51316 RepID=U6H1W6_9EIME|nr:phosphatidylcholine transfer protein, putative [Eimeria praecox]
MFRLKHHGCVLRDTTFADYRVIEEDVDGCEMIYCVMKAPFPISNRDFLQWRRTAEVPEEGIVKMMLRSADHPSVPEKSGCVRAETLMSGYLMRRCPEDPNSSTLFIVAQTDVKGLIPKWLVNSAAAKAPLGWVEALRRACSQYMKEQQSRL